MGRDAGRLHGGDRGIEGGVGEGEDVAAQLLVALQDLPHRDHVVLPAHHQRRQLEGWQEERDCLSEAKTDNILDNFNESVVG